MPLAVTLAGPRIVEAFDTADRTKSFFHGHSFTAHPLACALAAVNEELITRPEVLERGTLNGNRIRSKLEALRSHPRVADVRQCGSVVAVASAAAYLAARSQLRGEVDDALAARAEVISRIPIGVVRTGEDQFFLRIPGPQLGGPGGYVQVFGPQGAIRARGDDVELPVSDETRAAAAGERDGFYSDAVVAGIHVRILTTPIDQGYVLQIARPLTEVDANLDQLRNVLVLVTLGGIGLAAVLGLLVARTALAPVRRLTEAAEEVTETRDLSRRMADEGTDELGRLAGSFNTMLASLEESGADMSLADVARRLDVTRQTVYRYFPSVDHLILATANRATRPFTVRMMEHLRGITDPAAACVESLAFVIESLPDEKYLRIGLALGTPASRAAAVTSPMALEMGVDMLRSLDVDWDAHGYDDGLLREIMGHQLLLDARFHVAPK